MTDWRAEVPGPFTEVVPQVQKALTLLESGGIGIFVNVKSAPYNAAGDGITDDRTAIQAADTAAAAIGAAVYFPGTLNGYLVTGSVRPSSGVTWFGDGYKSQIKCPSAGWTQVAPNNMGIVNIDNRSNIRITGLRLTGTTSVAIATTAPFLIYLEGTVTTPLSNIQIDHNTFDNNNNAGIWEGGSMAHTTGITITDNYFTNISYTGTASGGAGHGAIQLNIEEGVIANNRFYQVSSAIDASGARMSITGNQIKDVSASGITTGDGNSIGVMTIAGNTIEFTEPATGNARKGIMLLGALVTDHLTTVVGNMVRAIGTASVGGVACYYVESGRFSEFIGNSAEIQVRGVGFSALGRSDGAQVTYKNNVVRVVSEGGQCYAFRGQPNGSSNSLNLVSADNKVFGITRANSSYAYDYSAPSGTLTGSASDDWAEQGFVSLGDVIYGNGAVPALDKIPFSQSFSVGDFSQYVRYPKFSMLNLQTPVGSMTIASGAINISGFNGGVGFPYRQTRLQIDTESGAATDDLDTINGSQDGDILILESVADGRDPTIKHNTGNILCGSDFTLDTTQVRIGLIYVGVTSKWVEIFRNRALQANVANTFTETQTFTKAPVFPTQTGVAQFGIDESTGAQLSIANDATATPFSNANNFSGLLMINDPDSTGETALFLIGGSSAVVLVSQTGSSYSTTQGTASKVNVYPNAGVITIENKRGATIGFRVFAIRMRNSG